jgi:hypothetical protein
LRPTLGKDTIVPSTLKGLHKDSTLGFATKPPWGF